MSGWGVCHDVSCLAWGHPHAWGAHVFDDDVDKPVVRAAVARYRRAQEGMRRATTDRTHAHWWKIMTDALQDMRADLQELVIEEGRLAGMIRARTRHGHEISPWLAARYRKTQVDIAHIID